MKIDNEFAVGLPIERAWRLLTDLEAIAPCLPGARLTGARLTGVEGDVYTGKVKIKVGPVVSEYAGTARFVEKDGDLSADADHEPLDLMAVAGRSVYKRLIPLGIVAALALVGVIVSRVRR